MLDNRLLVGLLSYVYYLARILYYRANIFYENESKLCTFGHVYYSDLEYLAHWKDTLNNEYWH